MPLYPPTIQGRHASTITGLIRRVAKLETRTAAIDSGFPLAALPAVISATYTTGNPQVYVNGATALSGPYEYLSSYTPVAGASVILLPVPAIRSYIVLGALG